MSAAKDEEGETRGSMKCARGRPVVTPYCILFLFPNKGTSILQNIRSRLLAIEMIKYLRAPIRKPSLPILSLLAPSGSW